MRPPVATALSRCRSSARGDCACSSVAVDFAEHETTVTCGQLVADRLWPSRTGCEKDVTHRAEPVRRTVRVAPDEALLHDAPLHWQPKYLVPQPDSNRYWADFGPPSDVRRCLPAYSAAGMAMSRQDLTQSMSAKTGRSTNSSQKPGSWAATASGGTTGWCTATSVKPAASSPDR